MLIFFYLYDWVNTKTLSLNMSKHVLFPFSNRLSEERLNLKIYKSIKLHTKSIKYREMPTVSGKIHITQVSVKKIKILLLFSSKQLVFTTCVVWEMAEFELDS